MVNSIMDGIAKALRSAYPTYKIYIDDVEQYLKRPAFFIALLSSEQEQKLDDRLWREHAFDIHFFPENEKKPTREINAVIDALRMALRYITVQETETKSSLVRGTDVRHEEVDGVLHFYINFNLFVRLPKEPIPVMESLEQKDELKIPNGG